MRRTAASVAIAASSVALGATVLGFLGAQWWAFDLLANLRLHLALLLGAGAAVLGSVGRRRVAAVAAAAAVVNAALIAPLYFAAPATPAEEDRLVIVSFNVQLTDPMVRIDWILRDDPDIVLLFESSRVAEELLAESATGYVVSSGIAEGRNFGPTILSRSSVEVTELPISGAGGGAVRVEVPLGDGIVVVYGVHPASPSNEARSHDRDRLLAAIGDAAAAEPLPVVVAGDFNATPWSHGFDLVSRPANLINSQRGFGYAATWPAGLWPIVGIPLDHLVHSDDLTTVAREVGPDLGPDHRPIRVTLAPANPVP